MSIERSRGWAVVTAASGTVLIGGGAFWLSFTALADLAVRSGIGDGQAWIWPLLVDGLIVVATVAVVALDGHRAAWYPWTLLIAGALVSVTANAAHALVTAEATVPGLLAATVAAVPPAVLLASTHLTTVLIRSTRTPDDPPADTKTDEARPPEFLASSSPLPEQSAPAALETPPRDPASGDVLGVEPTTESASSAPFENDPPARVGPGAGRQERAARLREAGWSNKQIAREMQVHPSTVGRWLPLPPTPDPEQGSSETSGPHGAGIPH
ncbi:DUF2637 domain-containing protein [Nesterenkonia sp. CL21]|uniref:DUF2637 domain-containing protein n=1 Tax=Nesterenkonia sp. CL21 TaxID=3064894 RepID=UPI00287A0188|nr:DUF2637 domain-containing protein [Nesterenkonia sp. CL21]MDS2171837.1 DUF2637 domain-containing protein [Nesterenkonia sp. CL21]